MTTPNPAIAQAVAATESGVNLAAAHGLTVPAEYSHAAECRKRAQAITQTLPPNLTRLPDKLDDLETEIAKIADKRTEHAAKIDVAVWTVDYAGRVMIETYRAAVPGFVDQLRANFAEAVEQFLTAREQAPGDNLSAWHTDDEIDAHRRTIRAAAALDHIAATRMQFGLNDNERGVHHSSPWHMLTPPTSDESDKVALLRDLLAGWRVNLQDWAARTSAERWTMLANAGTLELASLGETHTRAQAWELTNNTVNAELQMTTLGTQQAAQARADAVAH